MALPPLRQITITPNTEVPTKRIYTEGDIGHWKTTPGYLDYGLFIHRLSQAVVGQYLPYKPKEAPSQAINKTVEALDELLKWIDEIPPIKSDNQRFGNYAFRDWGKRLEERATSLLESLLGPNHLDAVPHVRPYFIQSFGSFPRIDYGTGHELAFAIFLCALSLIRFYQSEQAEERALVLIVFLKYCEVIYKLQDVYRLEPAGSHGVWGLDDYCFLPYIFGSGQLQEHLTSRPPDILKQPLEDITFFHMSVNRIHKLKTGPFHEHSPQLFSIISGVQTWWKVNQGLFKMYDAEVLGKRVVMQHLHFGGIIEWPVEDEEEEHIEEPIDDPKHLTAPAPFFNASPQASPQSGAAPLPGSSSPKPSGSPQPGTTALPPSPIRQGTMPRPQGGRIGAAIRGMTLAASPQGQATSLPSATAEEPPKPLPESTLPAVIERPSAPGTPDMRNDTDTGNLQPSTSPSNVAKNLHETPVDRRNQTSTPVVALEQQEFAARVAEASVDIGKPNESAGGGRPGKSKRCTFC